jgi:hypothetical protein
MKKQRHKQPMSSVLNPTIVSQLVPTAELFMKAQLKPLGKLPLMGVL